MTTIILVLLATLVVSVTLPLLYFAMALAFTALDKGRELAKLASLDAVQVFAAAHNARLDVETRREALGFTVLANTARLEWQRDYGRAMIAQQRQRLAGPAQGQRGE
jgi:hypothetical protein